MALSSQTRRPPSRRGRQEKRGRQRRTKVGTLVLVNLGNASESRTDVVVQRVGLTEIPADKHNQSVKAEASG